MITRRDMDFTKVDKPLILEHTFDNGLTHSRQPYSVKDA